ncbi:hypothetical protein C8Q74DRAFT_890959 [Fomes fomentarius]|nr:hypothetical protein C8Q74DRAFT_890959 [Fomes fomentarius]
MASSSLRNTSIPRPTVKRAAHTWPGNSATRNHFEDFLREIGASSETAHLLCCIPRPSATPCAHAHLHKRSRATSKPRSTSKPQDETRVSDDDACPHVPPSMPPRPETRGRTLSTIKVSGTLTSGLPISLKSPAPSAIDLENHDASGNYSYFSSARDTLLSCMSSIPVDERPSRAPTRSFHGPSSTRRASDSSSASSRHSPSSSSLSPVTSLRARAVSRGTEQDEHSRTRSGARTHSSTSRHDRSSSRTPSIDSLDTASSSEAPSTPRTQHELPPTLQDLERTSRFRVQSVCTTCKRVGSNFPSCAKCGDMWCSRECRVGTTGAGSHACHGRSASA